MHIIVADDHALIRDGVTMLIREHYPQALITETDCFQATENFLASLMCAAQATTRAKADTPPEFVDLLLLDLHMPDAYQGKALNDLCNKYVNLPIIIVSAFTTPDITQKALAYDNVYAFVSKGSGNDTILKAITAVREGIKLGLVETDHKHDTAENSLPPRLLTLRNLLKQGMSNKQIAHTLNLSEGTVKNYISELFRLLNVKNRTQAANHDENSPL